MSRIISAFSRTSPFYQFAGEHTNEASKSQSFGYYIFAVILVVVFLIVLYTSTLDGNNSNSSVNKSSFTRWDLLLTGLLVVSLVAPWFFSSGDSKPAAVFRCTQDQMDPDSFLCHLTT